MASNHINLDNLSSLQDPVEFTIGGKRFTVVDLTDEVQEMIDAIGDDQGLSAGEILSEQLALFTNSKAEEFDGLTYRQKAAAISHIMNCTTDPLGNRQQRRAAKR